MQSWEAPVKGHEAGTAGLDEEALSPTPPPTSFAFSTWHQGFPYQNINISKSEPWPMGSISWARWAGATCRILMMYVSRILVSPVPNVQEDWYDYAGHTNHDSETPTKSFHFFFCKTSSGKSFSWVDDSQTKSFISQWHRDTDMVRWCWVFCLV